MHLFGVSPSLINIIKKKKKLFFVNNIHMKRSNFRICFKYTKINERKSRFNETVVLVFLLLIKLNLGAIFDAGGRKASSLFIIVGDI